jgi:DNA-binding NarL/FixJ family response regulator
MSKASSEPKASRCKPGSGIRHILLVDDHELIRFGMSQLIHQVPGWEVCGEAEDAATALRIVRKQPPHLAVVDLSLQGGSGLTLIKQLSTSFPAVRILVCSMYEENLYAERALRAGAMGYVHKQQPARTLLAAMRRVMEGKTYLSPHQTDRLLARTLGKNTADSASSSVELLSDRELEVFALIGEGMTVKQIAEQLHVSAKTVEYHRDHIREKLGLGSSAEVTRQATIWNLEQG